ncbi:hypothetical protein [Mangrovimonas cancribranchiae]|uniref:Lipoprotein n=1 Tax=Mangrovimonas cancribranchiae TaxID=3080055 RepID=A0AAU6P5S8_9FLAO
MKKIGLLIIVILLIGCSSSRKMNKIKSQIDCNKTIHIVWDESSNLIRIESIGTYKNGYASFTKGKKLDYKETFKKSLEELNKKYKTKFIFRESHGFPSDSVIQVTIKIDQIVWNKGFRNATMDNYLTYQTTEKNIQITGRSKAQSYARAGKSLLQSFEHGNLLFLQAFCEN